MERIIVDKYGNPISLDNPMPVKQVASDIQTPVDIQGHRFDKFDVITAQAVAAGADFMATTTYDFSQYALVQYGIKTVSAGSGNANLMLYAIEGSVFKGSLKGSVSSNTNAWQPVTGATDVKGYDTLTLGFRNADVSSITVDMKAYCQY